MLIPPPPPPEAVTVTIPKCIGVTDRLVEKLIVPAVPTAEPSSLITTPDPDPVTPVNADPSNAGNAPLKLEDGTVPLKLLAVTTPDATI